MVWEQGRFFGKRRYTGRPPRRPRKIALSERGIYEPTILEENVVDELLARLTYAGVRVFRVRERIPSIRCQCPRCFIQFTRKVSAPSPAGHTDLHGYIPLELLPRGTQHPIPFYIEVKRPKGGVLLFSQEEFIRRRRQDGVLAFVARSWAEVKAAIATTYGITLRDDTGYIDFRPKLK